MYEGAQPYEEIEGARYAVWLAPPRMVQGDAFGWPRLFFILSSYFAFVLFNLCVLSWLFYHRTQTGAALSLFIGSLFALLAPLVWDALRARKRNQMSSFSAWQGAESDLGGIPCTAVLGNSLWMTNLHGLVSFHGSHMVFRCEGCRFDLQPSDLAPSGRDRVLRFRFRSPFGTIRLSMTFGGPSPSGWVSRKQARSVALEHVRRWRSCAPEGQSILPPLRPRFAPVAPGLIWFSVPVAILAMTATAALIDLIQPLILYPLAFPHGTFWEYVQIVAGLLLAWLIAVGLAWLWKRHIGAVNDRIDLHSRTTAHA